jgi:hypothetical protein
MLSSWPKHHDDGPTTSDQRQMSSTGQVHVSKFNWAYQCLFCRSYLSVSEARMLRQYCQYARALYSLVGGDRVGRGGHQGAPPPIGCYLVAVTAWMMA